MSARRPKRTFLDTSFVLAIEGLNAAQQVRANAMLDKVAASHCYVSPAVIAEALYGATKSLKGPKTSRSNAMRVTTSEWTRQMLAVTAEDCAAMVARFVDCPLDSWDSLHLAVAERERCEQLLTFDEPFFEHAPKDSPTEVVLI